MVADPCNTQPAELSYLFSLVSKEGYNYISNSLKLHFKIKLAEKERWSKSPGSQKHLFLYSTLLCSKGLCVKSGS